MRLKIVAKGGKRPMDLPLSLLRKLPKQSFVDAFSVNNFQLCLHQSRGNLGMWCHRTHFKIENHQDHTFPPDAPLYSAPASRRV
jgi:hypothetical protein